MGKLYCYFCRACALLQSPFLLIIRLFWGWQFFISGIGKFGNIQKVIDFFQTLEIPMPFFQAYFVASVEMIGGLLLIIGLFSRLAALFLSGTMIVAFLTAYRETVLNIFSDPNAFLTQDAFLFLFASLIVLIFGAGVFSVDYIWHRGHQKEIKK